MGNWGIASRRGIIIDLAASARYSVLFMMAPKRLFCWPYWHKNNGAREMKVPFSPLRCQAVRMRRIQAAMSSWYSRWPQMLRGATCLFSRRPLPIDATLETSTAGSYWPWFCLPHIFSCHFRVQTKPSTTVCLATDQPSTSLASNSISSREDKRQ